MQITDPYPAESESEAAPNSNMAAMEEDRIQRLVRELVSSEVREATPGSSIQQDFSNNSALPPVNVVGTFQNVNEEYTCQLFVISRRDSFYPESVKIFRRGPIISEDVPRFPKISKDVPIYGQ